MSSFSQGSFVRLDFAGDLPPCGRACIASALGRTLLVFASEGSFAMPDIHRASPMLIRMSAVVLIAATAGACSSLPDWLGGDSSSAAQPAPTADSAGAASDTGSQGRTVAEASDRYPALADTPSK